MVFLVTIVWETVCKKERRVLTQRDRQRDRETETDRQTDRPTDRQRQRHRERQRDRETERERERENSNLNSKTLILKDSSIRSIWTYLTASPCSSTNTSKIDDTTNKYYKYK